MSHAVTQHSMDAERAVGTTHNPEAETAVIGCMLLDQAAIEQAITSGLTPEDFYHQSKAQTARAILAVARRHEPVDLVSVSEELGRKGQLNAVGGAAFVSSMLSDGVRSANVSTYIGILKAHARTRAVDQALRRALRDLQDAGIDNALDRLTRQLEASTDALRDQTEPILEPAAAVAARTDSAGPEAIVPGLIFAGCITTFFGPERAFKSVSAREVAAAVATGRRAFHSDRMQVVEARPVAYFTEEDSAGAVLAHLDAFTDGAVSAGRTAFYLSCCRGLSLDDPRTQDRILKECAIAGPGLIVMEPLRSLSACVDQGPRELQPLTAFLRRLIRETGAAILLGHHAVKAIATGDQRKGGQRISGGGLLSISECPVEFARVSETSGTMTPRTFKHSTTPGPLDLRLDVAGDRLARLSAFDSAPDVPVSEVAANVVMDVVTANPGMIGSAIVTRTHVRRKEAFDALRRLSDQGRLRSETAGKAVRWYVV